MSSSAINTQVAQLKVSNIQNVGDTSSVCSTTGDWSFKNATATTTNVFISNAGNVGIGTSSPTLKFEISNGTNTGYMHPGVGIGLSIGTKNASPMTFDTNNTERMRIDASGNLRIRNPSGGATSTGVLIEEDSANTSRISIGGADAGAKTGLSLFSTGANAFRFFVSYSGQINATSTSIVGISDVSLKENVRDLETGLSQVLALKPRRFDWKEETQIDQKDVAGFIAQEVEEVLPELVYEYKYNETETKKSLKMGDMLPTLVKAIQEQQAQIEALKAEVAALKAP